MGDGKAGNKETEICVGKVDNGVPRYFIVISLSYRCDAQVLTLDPSDGRLSLWRSYANRGQAWSALRDAGSGQPVQLLHTGRAVLGYAVVATYAALLIAKRCRACASLPGGHTIYEVTESDWVFLPLQSQIQTEVEGMKELVVSKLEKLRAFFVDQYHYYCETADITRPFPSEHGVMEPSWDFVWNRWLSLPFRNLDLDFWVCPPLLQGLAAHAELMDLDGRTFSMCHMSRRSRLHAGTRYKARGLNDNADTGNEIECESIMWRRAVHDGVDAVRWTRYVWRRGTVPIRWQSNLNLGQAEIFIDPVQPFRGTRRYFRRLQKRYCPNPHLLTPEVQQRSKNNRLPSAEQLAATATASNSNAAAADSNSEATASTDHRGDPSMAFPIMLISLLRKSTPDKERMEAPLQQAFDRAVTYLHKHKMHSVTMRSIDWHDLSNKIELHGVVASLWCALEQVMPQHGFASGVIRPAEGGCSAATPGCSRWGAFVVQWQSVQTGLLRFNCQDSLDRTNVASFYAVIQVIIEQCRPLGLRVIGQPSVVLPASTSPATTAAASQMDGGAATALQAPQRGGVVDASKAAQAKRANAGIGSRISGLFGRNEARSSSRNSSPARSSDGSAAALPQSNSTGSLPAAAAADRDLPPGWECTFNAEHGRNMYIDHINQRVQWNPPSSTASPASAATQPPTTPPSTAATTPSAVPDDPANTACKAWSMFDKGIEDLRACVMTLLLQQWKEWFVIAGDRNAYLYTGSPAMHQNQLNLLLNATDVDSNHRNFSALFGNGLTSVHRRINNIFRDDHRQEVMEIFLGVRNDVRLRNMPLLYNDDAPVPLDYPDSDVDDDDGADMPASHLFSRAAAPASAAFAAASGTLLPPPALHTQPQAAPSATASSTTSEPFSATDAGHRGSATDAKPAAEQLGSAGGMREGAQVGMRSSASAPSTQSIETAANNAAALLASSSLLDVDTAAGFAANDAFLDSFSGASDSGADPFHSAAQANPFGGTTAPWAVSIADQPNANKGSKMRHPLDFDSLTDVDSLPSTSPDNPFVLVSATDGGTGSGTGRPASQPVNVPQSAARMSASSSEPSKTMGDHFSFVDVSAMTSPPRAAAANSTHGKCSEQTSASMPSLIDL